MTSMMFSTNLQSLLKVTQWNFLFTSRHYFQKPPRTITVRLACRRWHKFHFPDFCRGANKGWNRMKWHHQHASYLGNQTRVWLMKIMFRLSPYTKISISNIKRRKLKINSEFFDSTTPKNDFVAFLWFCVAIDIEFNNSWFCFPSLRQVLRFEVWKRICQKSCLERCRWWTRHHQIAQETTNKSPNKSVLTKYWVTSCTHPHGRTKTCFTNTHCVWSPSNFERTRKKATRKSKRERETKRWISSRSVHSTHSSVVINRSILIYMARSQFAVLNMLVLYFSPKHVKWEIF
jgi:hypothetical protein